MDNEIEALRLVIRQFAEDRDWDQFHSPKNLASALMVEAGELLEQFQWLTEEQSKCLSDTQKDKVKDEIADVFIYLIRLADKLEIDLIAAARHKITINAQKYPVAKARGSNKKYTDF